MEILKKSQQCSTSSMYFDSQFRDDFKQNSKKYSADLGCNEYLEIPSDIGQRKSKYRSTWGHKINHCFTRQNSQLVHYDSAQFGVVVAIRTLNKVSIPKGKEIFVHYGYSYSDGPKWYKDSFKRALKEQSVDDDSDWQQIRDIILSKANVTTIDDASSMVLDKLLKQHQRFMEFRT